MSQHRGGLLLQLPARPPAAGRRHDLPRWVPCLAPRPRPAVAPASLLWLLPAAASSPPLGCSEEGPGVVSSSLGSSLPDCPSHLWGIHVSPQMSLGGSESLMWVEGTLGAVLGREIALLVGGERQVVGRRCCWGG